MALSSRRVLSGLPHSTADSRKRVGLSWDECDTRSKCKVTNWFPPSSAQKAGNDDDDDDEEVFVVAVVVVRVAIVVAQLTEIAIQKFSCSSTGSSQKCSVWKVFERLSKWATETLLALCAEGNINYVTLAETFDQMGVGKGEEEGVEKGGYAWAANSSAAVGERVDQLAHIVSELSRQCLKLFLIEVFFIFS